MQKVNTSEYPEAESDYKKVQLKLNEEIFNLIDYQKSYPDDKILPLLLKIAKIKLQIFKIEINENFSKRNS